MNRDDREKLERLLRARETESPPDDLLGRLRADVPDEARIPDPDSRIRESYFGRPSVWLTAASLAMLFTFTFMLSRITFLDQSTEPDIATILDQQRRATKISESAAEEAPVGAAARKRPEVDEVESGENEGTQAPVIAPSPAKPEVRTQSGVSDRAAPAGALQRREEKPETFAAPMETDVAVAAPPPPPPAAAPVAREASRAAVVEKVRMDRSADLPAELRVSFTIDASGKVVEARVQSQPGIAAREDVERVLRRWTFETGRPGTFELLVRSSDLQPGAE